MARRHACLHELTPRPAQVVFKLRTGEVTEEERESTRLVDGVGRKCGLVRLLCRRLICRESLSPLI